MFMYSFRQDCYVSREYELITSLREFQFIAIYDLATKYALN
jgi:hypothetical protein